MFQILNSKRRETQKDKFERFNERVHFFNKRERGRVHFFSECS